MARGVVTTVTIAAAAAAACAAEADGAAVSRAHPRQEGVRGDEIEELFEVIETSGDRPKTSKERKKERKKKVRRKKE